MTTRSESTRWVCRLNGLSINNYSSRIDRPQDVCNYLHQLSTHWRVKRVIGQLELHPNGGGAIQLVLMLELYTRLRRGGVLNVLETFEPIYLQPLNIPQQRLVIQSFYSTIPIAGPWEFVNTPRELAILRHRQETQCWRNYRT